MVTRGEFSGRVWGRPGGRPLSAPGFRIILRRENVPQRLSKPEPEGAPAPVAREKMAGSSTSSNSSARVFIRCILARRTKIQAPYKTANRQTARRGRLKLASMRAAGRVMYSEIAAL